MKKVFSAENQLTIFYLKGVLESQDIPCVLRNEYLSGGVGELPPFECWPEIWVEDNHATTAKQIIADILHSQPVSTIPWHCPHCGESLEAQFSMCWKCGHSR